MLPLEMQAGEVVNDIPVPAIRRFRTAPRVNDATEAVVWRAPGFANRTATGQPTRSGRRRCGTEIPPEEYIDVGRAVRDRLDSHFIRVQGRTRRQSGLCHGGDVSAD